MSSLCLADFVAWYTVKGRRRIITEEDENENESDGVDEDSVAIQNDQYTKRKFSRVIRYRNYDSNDASNFKREMVTLFLPFMNEQVDILDRNKFIDLYSENFEITMAKR